MIEPHYLNLQYWFCLLYNLFGGSCTLFENVTPESGAPPELGVQAGESVSPGFFERIFSAYAETLGTIGDALTSFFLFIWHAYSVVAWSVSAFLFLAILIAFAGLIYIRIREWSVYSTLPAYVIERERTQRDEWDALLTQVKSNNPTLWRHAILEADQMLGALLGQLGYPGETTAERMRNLPEDAFVTVPVAWEAHRVRNFVAHGASNFILTQREAFRVMKLYEQVFEEFGVV
jgi:hypothetical protein